jgi:hypothetical protein
MPLGLEAQMSAYFLERRLHSPTPHEPRNDPLGLGFGIGAQQSLGLELFPRIAADQHPAQGHGG